MQRITHFLGRLISAPLTSPPPLRLPHLPPCLCVCTPPYLFTPPCRQSLSRPTMLRPPPHCPPIIYSQSLPCLPHPYPMSAQLSPIFPRPPPPPSSIFPQISHDVDFPPFFPLYHSPHSHLAPPVIIFRLLTPSIHQPTDHATPNAVRNPRRSTPTPLPLLLSISLLPNNLPPQLTNSFSPFLPPLL
jgi:hypothetical protein